MAVRYVTRAPANSRSHLTRPLPPQQTLYLCFPHLAPPSVYIFRIVSCGWFKGYGLDMEKEIGVGLQANGEYRGRCVAHMDAIYWVKR